MRLGAIGGSVEVHVDDEAEILRLHLGEAPVAEDAGIVDEDVDAAPARLGGLDHRDHLVIVGDAAAVRYRLAARGLDLRDHRERGVRMAGAVAGAAEIVDHHLRPAPRELEGIGTAQPAAGAGDDGNAIVEPDGHGSAPLLWSAS